MNCKNQSFIAAGHSQLLLAAQAAYEYLSSKVSVADADYGVVTGLAAAISDVLDGNAAPDAVLEESKAMAASGDRVGALKHYRAGKGCSLEEARDAIYPGEATPDFPAGAIHNGRVHAERLEATGLECDAGSLQLCNDWVEFRRCFEHLAQWAEGQSAKESP